MAETTERMVPSKEEWDSIIKSLSGMFGTVELLVDGYKVHICRRQVKRNRLASVVYVNGYIKGEWLKHHKSSESIELPEETKRFYRRLEKSFNSRKELAQTEKIFGKRWTKKHGYYDKFVYYSPEWPSATALKRHLLKNNHNIELVKGE